MEKIIINRPHLKTFIQAQCSAHSFAMETGSVEIAANLCIHRNNHGSITLMKQLPVLCRLVDNEPKSLFTKIKEWIWK